jgi:CrcB protein
MVLVTEVWTAHELVRPFLGTGVLGGYTTFSTYGVDVQQLVAAGSAGTALLYLAGTLAAALVAVAAGLRATRALARRLGGLGGPGGPPGPGALGGPGDLGGTGGGER